MNVRGLPHGAGGRARAPGQLLDVLGALAGGQERARSSLNLTPSENILSPAARLPFLLDAYARYFFDHRRRFGAWSFYGALDVGVLEQETLLPLLRRLTGAAHVNVQPISGLNCMTVVIAALARQGGTILVVPPECGGHMSTMQVAARLGVRALPLPMRELHEVDLEALPAALRRERPSLVYLDQSTQLFPIDPNGIRACVDVHAPETVVHYDSSHLNGLILLGAHPNPLDRGAHSFGGSTHKTLPGPHKGFVATRDAEVARRVDEAAGIFVSHHHPAEVVSLLITLLELVHYDGAGYARRVLENARHLAARLYQRGVCVAEAERGFTACHQVWVDPADGEGGVSIADALMEAGVAVNRLGDIPGFATPGFRLSSAEVTRRGADAETMDELAGLLAEAILARGRTGHLHSLAEPLRRRLARPRYCLQAEDLADGDIPADFSDLLPAIERLATSVRSEPPGCPSRS